MKLPCKATIVAFAPADGVGTLELQAGEQLRFGASACLGFTPELGIACWLLETKPTPGGAGVRAKSINLSGVPEPDRATQIKQAGERVAEDARREAERLRRLGDRPYETVLERTRGFEVPLLYRRMESDGVLRYGDSVEQWERTCEARALHDPPALLCVYDFEWLSPMELATWEPPDYWKPEHVFVPFAHTGRGDLWCWYPAWATGSRTPVVFVHEDEDKTEARAPDFESLLLREMLAQFACSSIEDGRSAPSTGPRSRKRAADNLRKRFRAGIETLQPYIRGEWTSLLVELADRPFGEIEDQGGEPLLSLLSIQELQEILDREMPFPHAGTVFEHMS